MCINCLVFNLVLKINKIKRCFLLLLMILDLAYYNTKQLHVRVSTQSFHILYFIEPCSSQQLVLLINKSILRVRKLNWSLQRCTWWLLLLIIHFTILVKLYLLLHFLACRYYLTLKLIAQRLNTFLVFKGHFLLNLKRGESNPNHSFFFSQF